MNPIHEISFGEFMSRAERTTPGAPRLVQAMVELTYGCNLRCVHCYNPTHEAENELSTAAVKTVLKELADQGCLRVGFTGGELFTRRDAMDILLYARELGLVVNVLTNATMVTPALADRIKALDLFQVDVSVYGATADTYEEVTRVRGSFARFVAGLNLLAERNVPLLLKLVLLKPNVHEHQAMRHFAIARGLRFQVSTDVHPRVDGSREPLAYRLDPDQAFEVWRFESGEQVARHLADGCSGSGNETGCRTEQIAGARRVFHCRCGRMSAAVTPHGRLNLCLSIYHPLYDLSQGTIGDGWRRLVDLVAATEPGPKYECNGCALTVHCSRGVGDSWLQDHVFDRECIPYFRDLAERKATFMERRAPAAKLERESTERERT